MTDRQFHLLAIDDEPIHRRGMVSLVQELRPSYLVFSARDGFEGLEMVNRNRIDIVLTDIRMAGMDGLEFIRRLGPRLDATRVIIISAYNRFDYARQALRLGAFDYLLKPIVREDLERIIEKTEESLREDEQRRNHNTELLIQLETTAPAYDQQLLNRWVRGEIQPEQLIEHLSPKMQEQFARLVAAQTVQICLTQAIKQGQPERGIDNIQRQVLSQIDQELAGYAIALSFLLEGEHNTICTAWAIDPNANQSTGEDSQESNSIQAAKGVGERIWRTATQAGAPCTVGVGKLYSDPKSNVFKSYQDALMALDTAFYLGDSSIILYSEVAYLADKSTFSNLSLEARLGDAIAQLQREQAAELLDMLISQVLAGGYPSSRHMKESILYLLVNRTRALESALSAERAGNLIAEMEFRILESASLVDMQVIAHHYLGCIMDEVEERKSGGARAVLQSCVAYIEENFHEDLALESVARRYYFSPAYFSALFKSQMGQTFTEYVTQRRIEAAKTQLVDESQKVSAIALSVGFRDASYFTRVFRREVGLSPEEFRKNIHR